VEEPLGGVRFALVAIERLYRPREPSHRAVAHGPRARVEGVGIVFEKRRMAELCDIAGEDRAENVELRQDSDEPSVGRDARAVTAVSLYRRPRRTAGGRRRYGLARWRLSSGTSMERGGR
jgi:hypothetical protein